MGRESPELRSAAHRNQEIQIQTKSSQLTPVGSKAGSLCESFGHECLKSLLAFRKPATAVASRRPARADGLMVGLDGHASLSAGRAPWRDGQAFLPLRRRPPKAIFVVDAGRTMLECTSHASTPSRLTSDVGLLMVLGGTQWHPLSATIKQPS